MWTKRRSYTCVWQLEKLHVAVTLLFSCANIVKVLTKAKYLEQQVIRLIRVYTTCPRCSKTGRGNVLEGNVRPFSVNQAWLRAQWTLVAPQRISCPDANEISCVCIAHRRFHWTEFFTAEIYVYRVRFRVADKKQTRFRPRNHANRSLFVGRLTKTDRAPHISIVVTNGQTATYGIHVFPSSATKICSSVYASNLWERQMCLS